MSFSFLFDRIKKTKILNPKIASKTPINKKKSTKVLLKLNKKKKSEIKRTKISSERRIRIKDFCLLKKFKKIKKKKFSKKILT